MIRISLKMLVAVVLSGCTVNSFQPNSFTTVTNLSHLDHTVPKITIPEEKIIIASPPPAAPVVVGNLKIKPECSVYVPLAAPVPVRVDFKDLEAATTSKEINAVILRNARTLRKQMLNYSVQQQHHYGLYVRTCVVK